MHRRADGLEVDDHAREAAGRHPAHEPVDQPRARLVGENIAAGMTNAAEAVQGWLDSPDHCENVMDARFTHLGAAFATNLTRDPAVYWTMDLAAAREPARPLHLALNATSTRRPAAFAATGITLAARRD